MVLVLAIVTIEACGQGRPQSESEDPIYQRLTQRVAFIPLSYSEQQGCDKGGW